MGFHIDIVGNLRYGESAPILSNMHMVNEIVMESRKSKIKTLFYIVQSIFLRRGLAEQKFRTRKYIETITTCLKQRFYNLVIIDHSQMGWTLNFIPSYIKIALISHNVECSLYRKLSRQTSGNVLTKYLYGREAVFLFRMEKRLLSSVHYTWVLTQDNMTFYKKLFSKDISIKLGSVCVPPMISSLRPQRQILWDIGLIGTWSWEPNKKGLLWFFDKVYPSLPTSLSVCVAGIGADWLRSKYKNVQYIGFVENANQFVYNSKLIAIPSITGDGVQIKTIQTIALGVNIVATSFALRGLHKLPSYVYCCDNPKAFAHLLADLINGEVNEYVIEAQQWCDDRKRVFLENISSSLDIIFNEPNPTYLYKHISFNCCSVNISILRKEQIFLPSNNIKHIITMNAESFVKANKDRRFRDICNSNYTTIDGQIPLWIFKAKHPTIEIEKLSGSDIIYDICRWASELGWKVFFLGGCPQSNSNAVTRISKLFHSLNIIGLSPDFEPYPFSQGNENGIRKYLLQSQPQILFVGFGMGKQEFWIDDHRDFLESIGVKLVIGCGGTFDIVSGKFKRAWPRIQKLGLEGVWRLCHEFKLFRIKRLCTSFKIFKYINA